MSLDEKNIATLIRKRDLNTFRYLYEQYFRQMVLFAESYLYDEEEARDLVQDIFFSLWDKAGQLEITSSIKSYLFAALRNRCLNALRNLRVRDDHYEKFYEALVFSEIEDIEIEEEVREKLQQALDSLPEKCKEILLLKVVHGKKNREIARELNLAETTVKTQIQRAYRMLRERFLPIILLIVCQEIVWSNSQTLPSHDDIPVSVSSSPNAHPAFPSIREKI